MRGSLLAGWLVAVLPVSAYAEPAATPSTSSPNTAQPRVLVRRIQIIGNTVLPEDVINAIIVPYLVRALDFNDIEELRNLLTRAYVDRGYINTGVVLPDQTV